VENSRYRFNFQRPPKKLNVCRVHPTGTVQKHRPNQLTSLEAIETTVRQQMLETCESQHRPFLSHNHVNPQGKLRQVKSCLGVLNLKSNRQNGVASPYSTESPAGEMLFTPMCQQVLPGAETDAHGVKVSHSTQRQTGEQTKLPSIRSSSRFRSEYGWGRVRLRGAKAEVTGAITSRACTGSTTTLDFRTIP